MGGKPNNAPPPMQKKRPPPPTHGTNGPHMERKDCPHGKKKPIGEPPPHRIFLFPPPSLPSPLPPGERLLSPLRAPIMISTHFIPLFERVRKNNQQKLNPKKFSCTFT